MQSNAQRSDTNEENEGQRATSARPVKSYSHGGVQLDVWKNSTQSGDVYNTTIRKSYKDEKTNEWKESSSFSATDLTIVAQLSSQAFQDIVQLKAQGRGR